MHPIWSGVISFGLVNIPVRLFSPSAKKPLEFHFLHKKDRSPIGYTKMCLDEDKKVEFSELVHGFEYKKGEYITLSDEDFKKANVRKSQSIDILDFVELSQIDTAYFEKPYFLEPAQGGEKAYAILRESLKSKDLVGIAKFVLRTREHLTVLKPSGDLLILNQIRYRAEIKAPTGLRLPDKKIAGKRELEMASKLIDQFVTSFRPQKYHDTYSEDLMALIKQKSKGRTPKPKGKQLVATKVPDLMAKLLASLEPQRVKK